MTCVSVAQAARHLGIDVKTLRRWLAEAQLPLQSHPVDGRKKGISQEQLQQLSRLHHRHLASSSEEALARLSSQLTTLPADLLSLPEQFCALQTQIAVLRASGR
jgi:transposase